MSPFVIPGLGFQSSVLMKHESTYGTAASGAAEHASELISSTITPRLSTIIDPSLTSTQRSARFIGQGGQYYEWTVKVRVGYNGLLPWIRMMFPSYAHALVDTTAHSHVFKEVGVLSPSAGYGQAQWGYTIDIAWGGNAANPTRLIGALATGWRLTGQAGTGDNAMLMLEISGVCKTVTPNLASGALTTVALPTALGVLFHQQTRTTGNFGIGTGTIADSIQLKGFEVNIQQPMDTQRYLFGQVNAESPVPNGIMDCSFAFDLEYTPGAAEFLSALAGGGATVKLFFKHPTVIGATTATSELEVRSLTPTTGEFSTAIEGYGVVTQRLTQKAAYNATDASAVFVRAQNTDAAMVF